MNEEFELIADDEQAKKMNEEYEKLGIAVRGKGKDGGKTDLEREAESREISREEKVIGGSFSRESATERENSEYVAKSPLPIYARGDCYRYLQYAESIGAIINSLDGRFVSEYRQELEYVYVKEDKNSIYVRALADIKSDVRADYTPMPLKKAMTTLIRLALAQSAVLDKILAYDKSRASTEIRLNQLSLVGALNSLICILQ